jgi:hypothetical protein
MSLIDSTYTIFTNGSFKLNLQELDSDVLDSTCEHVEKDYLQRLMGDVEHNSYVNNPTSAEFVELENGYKVDGKFEPFTYAGKKYIYRGLKDMLAFFTYFHYIQGDYNFNPNLSEKINVAITLSPEQNAFRAYNLGYKGYYDAYIFIKYKQSLGTGLFPDFVFEDIELINSFGI